MCIRSYSGGVGIVAAQIAKAGKCYIVAKNAAPALHDLGITNVIDYRSPDAEKELINLGPYDIILDCAGKGGQSIC